MIELVAAEGPPIVIVYPVVERGREHFYSVVIDETPRIFSTYVNPKRRIPLLIESAVRFRIELDRLLSVIERSERNARPRPNPIDATKSN